MYSSRHLLVSYRTSTRLHPLCRHIQLYPHGFPSTPDKMGVFIAGFGNQLHRFRITIINQHNPKHSVSKGGSLNKYKYK